MPTILEAVGTYIDNNNATLALGTNLFLAKMPDSPDVCVCLYEYEGFAPIESFGTASRDVDRPSVQVVVRAARDDYPAARDLADTLRTLVAGMSNVSVAGVAVMRVTSSGSLYPLGADALDRPRVVFNLDCHVDV
jgi:hypothetical protein